MIDGATSHDLCADWASHAAGALRSHSATLHR